VAQHGFESRQRERGSSIEENLQAIRHGD